MFEFHKDYIKNKYGKKLKLLFTDTDTSAYKIETENVITILVKIKCLIVIITFLNQNITMIQM